jgi:hypothetical protein
MRSHWRADGKPKVRYASQQEALAAAEEQRFHTGADLAVYRCDFCSSWHMSSASTRR